INTSGVDQPKWTAAHNATGPTEQCGATAMSWARARAATFLPTDRPPQWARSGWTTSQARIAASRPNSSTVYSRSPAATRNGNTALTAFNPSRSSGATGSSYHAGRYGASRRPTSTAHAPDSRPWTSIISSTSAPTASRTAATIRTAASILGG